MQNAPAAATPIDWAAAAIKARNKADAASNPAKARAWHNQADAFWAIAKRNGTAW